MRIVRHRMVSLAKSTVETSGINLTMLKSYGDLPNPKNIR